MDPIITGALIGGGASLLGGLFGSASSASQNAALISAQREAAQKKYQWAVADMEKAGLNPKLAGTQAASVSGANLGSGVQDTGGKLTQGLTALGQIAADAVVKTSTARKQNAEAELATEQATSARFSQEVMRQQATLLMRQWKTEEQNFYYRLAQTAQSQEQAAYYRRLAENAGEEFWRIRHEAERTSALADRERLHTKLYSDFYGEYPWAYNLERFGSSGKDLAGVIDTAVGDILKVFFPKLGTVVDSVTSVGKGTVRKTTTRRAVRGPKVNLPKM